MTKEQFANLKPGDVLRWKRPQGDYILRTVLDIHCHRTNPVVTFPIRQKSWTGRVHTCYSFTDIGHRVELHDERTEMLMTGGELLRLCDRGFDIPAQLRREVDRYGCFRDADDTMLSKFSGAATLARKFCTA